MGEQRRSQQLVWQGVIVGGIGALAAYAFGEAWPLLFVVLGGMLLFAGLIGEAVRAPDVPAPEQPRRPWDDR